MKTIYISGSITDLSTGQPRNDWQVAFLDAEAKLRRLGFSVINPVDIAREVEEDFARKLTSGGAVTPTRTDYILACLQRMKSNHEKGSLHGVYVIGNALEAILSDGVQMELHMAHILDIPIYAKFYNDELVSTAIVPQQPSGSINDLLKDQAL